MTVGRAIEKGFYLLDSFGVNVTKSSAVLTHYPNLLVCRPEGSAMNIQLTVFERYPCRTHPENLYIATKNHHTNFISINQTTISFPPPRSITTTPLTCPTQNPAKLQNLLLISSNRVSDPVFKTLKRRNPARRADQSITKTDALCVRGKGVRMAECVCGKLMR